MDYTIIKRLAFKYYNRAKQSKAFDQARVNRALGLALSERKFTEAVAKYGTTVKTCMCPDNQNRNVFCKHQIAFMINFRMWEEVQQMIENNEPILEFNYD